MLASALFCRNATACGGRHLRSQEHTSCSYSVSTLSLHYALDSRTSRSGRRRHVVVARSSPDEYYDNLFNSPVFRSDLVKQEFTKMVNENMQLSQMASKFPDFDLAGKRMYLDKMEELSGRYEIFIKRLELSGDPASREFLRFNNAQMLESGFTYNQLFAGLKQSLDYYRKWVAEEERVSSDPVAHQRYLEALRNNWNASLLGKLDMSFMFEKVDPQIVMKAYNAPQFWVAIREISENPTPAVMAKWMDDPSIGPFVAEMWKGMQR
ncbi:hypothetical protein PLESTF_000795500 [Pleodorina starrii]|nr:hypothetical protein PLESTF_000795500 [Pleodorina starrii]